MKPKLQLKMEVWQGASENWYWRLRARNGKIIADGAEGYKTRAGVKRAARNFLNLILDAELQGGIKIIQVIA